MFRMLKCSQTRAENLVKAFLRRLARCLSYPIAAAPAEVLLAVLWNLHAYYSQFVEAVEATVARLRAPIEKKLKDFVKIARWNDISYWAIRETVEKTHRTLLKHVKAFEVSPSWYCKTPAKLFILRFFVFFKSFFVFSIRDLLPPVLFFNMCCVIKGIQLV